MKTLLTVSQGRHFAARAFRTMAVLLVGLALGASFWIATTPVANAQVPAAVTRMIEANLPRGQTMAKAGKADLLSAVCAAIKKNRGSEPQIVRMAVEARPQWSEDILRAAFNCVGTGRNNCKRLGEIYRAIAAADSGNTSDLTDLAIELAPDCASAFTDDRGQGNFANAPANQNPAPGSVGGGSASQAGRCQVCHRDGQGRRRTLTISCNAVPAHLGHGDTEGPCPVTPTQNP